MVVLMTRRLRAAIVTLASTSILAPVPGLAQEKQEQPRQVIRVVAERFTFSPSRIRVEQGAIVEIRLRSEDTNHGFRVPGKNINVVIPKRGRGEVTVLFDTSKPGRYAFECSKPCGAGHSMMRGEIIVE
jgi:cytochrome c oxidase subunit II